jgi:hypothetical protein
VAVERILIVNPEDELHPNGGRMAAKTKKKATATKNPKRVAAGRKAAKTRAAKAEAKLRAAKKAAKTRAAAGASKKAPRKPNPSTAKATAPKKPGKRNPGFGGGAGLGAMFKAIVKVATVAIPVVALGNVLASWPLKKDSAGNVQQTLADRVGPWFGFLSAVAALWAVPRYVLKGKLAAYKATAVPVLQTVAVLQGLRSAVWLARRDWDGAKPALLPTDSSYPRWTDYLELPAPVPQQKALVGPPDHRQLGRPGDILLARDPASGAFVRVAA